jgi:hypothetical protein
MTILYLPYYETLTILRNLERPYYETLKPKSEPPVSSTPTRVNSYSP